MEKAYKTMKTSGAINIALGVVVLVLGLASYCMVGMTILCTRVQEEQLPRAYFFCKNGVDRQRDTVLKSIQIIR